MIYHSYSIAGIACMLVTSVLVRSSFKEVHLQMEVGVMPRFSHGSSSRLRACPDADMQERFSNFPDLMA